MWQDAVFSLRTLRRQPGFFLLAVGTLALGIASTTAVFSLFYQILLRTLPVPAPRELVVFHADGLALPGSSSSDNSETVYSYPLYTGLRDGAPRQWKGIAARSSSAAQLMTGGATERVRIEVVSGNFFDTLQLAPYAGRLLTPADDTTPGGHPVAVLSHGLFQRRFAANPAVIGSKITLNGQPFEVLGVTPPNFHGILGGDSPDLYLPIAMRPAITPGWKGFDQPGIRWLTIFGRLSDGASGDLQPLFATIVRDHVERLKVTNPNARQRLLASTLSLRPAASGLNEMKRRWQEPLTVLLAMVGLLLLIACANLANLLLARGVNRAREIAIRVSIGATRWQIVRLLLIETAAISAAGAVLGTALAPLLVQLLLRAISEETDRESWLRTDLSLPVLAFSIGLGCLAVFLAGLVPAWQISRPAARKRTGRARHFFVAAQVALSLVLLTVAGLFGRSFANLLQFDPGFQPAQLTSFVVNPAMGGYDGPRGLQFPRDVAARLAALPGASAVTFAEWGPLQNSTSTSNIQVEGYRAGEDENMNTQVMAVGPAYFRTLGTPLVAGREIEARDLEGAPKVAVVNQAFVKRFGKPGESLLGRHLSIGAGSDAKLDIEIVGIAADTRHQSLRETVQPVLFRSYEQAQEGRARAAQATFFVRSADPAPAPTLRAAVAQVDPQLAVYNLRTMDQTVARAIATDRLIAALAGGFGALALTITAVGLFGVLSYLTRRRTTEFGVRMALGATRGHILRLVFREVLLLVGAGALVGIAGALAAGKAIASQLFGITGFDPAVLAGAPLALGLVAALAAALPSIRAAAVHPLEALRHD